MKIKNIKAFDIMFIFLPIALVLLATGFLLRDEITIMGWQTFREQFWPQLIATIIGIAIGIPVALWISGFQEKRTEKERKEKIIDVLTTELILNEDVLQIWVSSEHQILDTIRLAKLTNEAWEAFKGGGELEWIKDSTGLWVLTDVYASIKSVQRISERYLDIKLTKNQNSSLTNEILAELGEAIESALGMIDDNLKIFNYELHRED